MISAHPKYISGRESFEAGDYEAALHDYNLALADEENPSIYSERAVVYYHLRMLELSLADMDYAAGLEPYNPYRYASRAYIKDAMGDTEGAIKDYEKAVALDPDDSIAHNNLGLLQEKLGYKDKAKRNFQRADQLADVDKLLQNIEDENGFSARFESQQTTVITREEENQSEGSEGVVKLLKRTFLTKQGFLDYIAFLRNGFVRR